MNRLLLTAVLLTAGLSAEETGSISGVVLDSAGRPMSHHEVAAFGPKRFSVTTDADGKYSFRDAASGRYRVRAHNPPFFPTRVVDLGPGEDLAGVDFKFQEPAEIRGRVLDDNGEPIPEVSVFLIGTEYRFGALRHTYREAARTDDRGEYRLQRWIRPGVRYTVLAKVEDYVLPAVSDAPGAPDARRPAFQSTFFPSAPDVSSAERLVLRAGEIREATDIRMRRTPSYCVSGVLHAHGAPGILGFEFTELQPSSGMGSEGGSFTRSPRGQTGPDGRFRICDLAPGEYRLLALSPPPGDATQLAAQEIVIIDRDVEDLAIHATAMTEVPAELVWAGEAPAEPVTRELTISLRPVYRSYRFGEVSSTIAPMPGEFSYPPTGLDAFEVVVHNLADDWHIADIEYGGRSILHDMLRIGSARPDSRLRISIGRDGGRIQARVSDRAGDPVPGADVYVLPESAGSEAALSAAMTKGSTDQRGGFESGTLAPGKYRLVATRRELDMSPESIRLLWLARGKAPEAEVGGKAGGPLKIELMSLAER